MNYFRPGFTPPIVLEGDERLNQIMKDAWEEREGKVKKEHGNFTIVEYDRVSGPNTELLRQEAIKLLETHSFKINKDEFFIEFHHSRVLKLEYLDTDFDWHIADGTNIDTTVVTVTFFVYKDPLLDGGNIFWNPNGKKEDWGKALTNTKSGTIVIMPGDTPRVPEGIRYNGHRFKGTRRPQERKVIEFQFPDLRRQIVQDEGLEEDDF